MSNQVSLTANLDARAKQDLVQKALDINIKNASVAKAYPQFVETVGNSQLFQLNWDELLAAAPTSLSLMGACLIAASSKDASDVVLSAPADGFKYLSTNSLRASLVETVNKGTTSFQIADRNMDAIMMTSGKLYETIEDIMQDLSGTAEDAQIGLPVHTDNLKRGAELCRTRALAIDKAFNDWLNFVSELHVMTVFTAGTNAEQKQATENSLLAEQTKLDFTQQSKDKAEDAVKTLKSSLETSQAAFKDASDKFPNGWDIVGMEFVSGLSKAVLGGVNNMINKKTGGSGNGANNDSSKSTKPKALPEDHDDPAYAQVHQIQGPINSLKGLVCGGKGGAPDWDEITKPQDNKDALSYIKSMLDFAATNGTSGRKGKASADLKSVLDTASAMVAKLIKISVDLKKLNSTPPSADSAEVKSLQADMANIISKVATLASTSNSMPGMGGGEIPLTKEPEDSDSSSASGGIAEQILSGATNRLKMTQEAFVASQENYQKATNKLADLTVSLGTIKAELAKLTSEKIRMEQVKVILNKAVQLVISLKAQIVQLVQFFDAVLTLVEFVTKEQVNPFLAYLMKAIEIQKEKAVAGFTFSEIQRQFIYTSTITVRSYYRVFRRIAKMYIQVSRDHIMPGLQLVNRFSEVDLSPSQIAKNSANLTAFTDQAVEAVKSIVSESQEEIRNQLQDQFKDTAANTRLLPGPPPVVVAAIEEGKKVVTEAAATGIATYKPPVARSLSVPLKD